MGYHRKQFALRFTGRSRERGASSTGTPANTATVRVVLLNHLNSGWVVFDDVMLTAVTTNAAAITRKTYALGGQPIAMRASGYPAGETGKNGLFYTHSDHLGSASVMSYGQEHANNLVGKEFPGSRGRYYPYGGWRVTPTAGLTDRGYTGHRHNNLGSAPDDLGLIFMQARYYLPGAGRFISADVLLPDPKNPQQFNRYSYVLNNALRYTDPSGRVCYDHTAGPELLGTCVNPDGSTYSLLPMAQQAIDQYCATASLACSGTGIGYITINLYFLKNLAGYDPGVVRLPYHINPNYSSPNSLFPWEGVANVAYAEHSSLHPRRHPRGTDEREHFTQYWLGEATGIIQTMINRATDGNYQSPNHAALTAGQYAAPGRNLNDTHGVYQEFYGLAFMVIQLEVRVDQPYQYFAHQDLLPLRGKGSHLNDVCCTDTAGFGPTWHGPKNWYIPQTYPYIFR